MVRPRLRRCVRHHCRCRQFKPAGIPGHKLETIELTSEEMEALRLKNVLDLDQIDAAKQMETSQSTFQRILSSAYKKVSIALVKGKKINIID